MNEHSGLEWIQFNINEVADPSGSRHIKEGPYAFVKVVGSGACVSGLAFGNVTIDLSEGYKDNYVSTPVVLIFRLNNIDSGSGINNFRFYLNEDSALNNDGNEPKPYVQMVTSGTWPAYGVLPSGIGTKLVLNEIPISPNVLRQDGKLFISGTGDASVSEYIIMNVVCPARQLVGSYGICGSGSLRFALKYDLHEIV